MTFLKKWHVSWNMHDANFHAELPSRQGKKGGWVSLLFLCKHTYSLWGEKHFSNDLTRDFRGLLLLLSRLSRVRLCATPRKAAHQAPLPLGFSRQEHWSGLPFPSPMHESEKWKWSRSVVSDSSWLHGLQPTGLLRPWDFPGKSTGVGCHCLLSTVQYIHNFYVHWEIKTFMWLALLW